MSQDEIALKLSQNEALVFFEWLASVEATTTSLFKHPSEQKVLWNLQCQLESTLVEPFAPNYDDILAEARRAVESGE